MKKIYLIWFIIFWQIPTQGFCQKIYSDQELRVRESLVKKYGDEDKADIVEEENKVLVIQGEISKELKSLNSHKEQLNQIINSQSSNQQIRQMLSKNIEYIDAIENEYNEIKAQGRNLQSITALNLYKGQLNDFLIKVREYTGRLKGAKKVVSGNVEVSNLENELDSVAGDIAKISSTESIEKNVLTKFLGDKSKTALAQIMRQNPFAGMSKSELKNMFTLQMQGSPLGRMLKNNPRTLNILVEVFHDKEALPKFLTIVNESKKIKIYGLIVISVFILSLVVGFMNSKANFFKKIFYKIMTIFTALLINLLAFYLLFRDQVGPLLKATIRGLTL